VHRAFRLAALNSQDGDMKEDDRECLRLGLAALVKAFLQRRLQNVQKVDAAREQQVTQLTERCRVSFDMSLNDGRKVHFDRNHRGLTFLGRPDRDNEIRFATIRPFSASTDDESLARLSSKLVEIPGQDEFPACHKEKLLNWLIGRVKLPLGALLEPPLDSPQKVLRRPRS
jgi:hypothetical protein